MRIQIEKTTTQIAFIDLPDPDMDDDAIEALVDEYTDLELIDWGAPTEQRKILY